MNAMRFDIHFKFQHTSRWDFISRLTLNVFNITLIKVSTSHFLTKSWAPSPSKIYGYHAALCRKWPSLQIRLALVSRSGCAWSSLCWMRKCRRIEYTRTATMLRCPLQSFRWIEMTTGINAGTETDGTTLTVLSLQTRSRIPERTRVVQSLCAAATGKERCARKGTIWCRD